MIRPHRRPSIARVCWALVLLSPGPAEAQEDAPAASDAAQAEARARYEAGAVAYGSQDYAAALVEFRASYEALPTPRALLSIGLCQHGLEDYPAARESLGRYLEEGGDAVPEEIRAQVGAVLAEIAERMARLVVDVSEPNALVVIDGMPIGISPLPEPVELGPGEHVIEARRDGFRCEPARVALAPGRDAAVQLVLAALPGAVRVDSGAVVAAVSVDGSPAGSTPLELELAAGDHDILLEAQGYREERRSVSLAPGTLEVLTVVLEPATDGPSPEPEEEEGVGARYWWVWTAIGILAAGGAVTAGVLLWPKDAAAGDWSWRMR